MEDAKKVNNTKVSNLLLGKKKNTLIISNIPYPPPPQALGFHIQSSAK